MPDVRHVALDPREPAVWRHEGPWWAPLAWRPHVAAVGMGVFAIALTVLMAVVEDLPIRDADGMLGKRFWLLVGILTTFFALEIGPRALSLRRASGMALADAVRTTFEDRWSRRRLRIALMGIVAFYATYISYRNIKSFLPFVVDQDMDGPLLAAEASVFGTDPATLLHQLLGTGASAEVLSTVYLAYLGFVPVTLGAAFILSINPLPGLWWVTTLSLNWLLGALSYYLVPALGPVFYAPELFASLPQTGVSDLQHALLVHRVQVLADPFGTGEVQSIAAFASLHVSVVFSAVLMAHLLKLPLLVRVGLWAFLALTILATVYFGWHYVLDDIAGLAIGGIAVVLAGAATGHLQALRDRGLAPR